MHADDQIKKSILRNAERKQNTNEANSRPTRNAGSFKVFCQLMNVSHIIKLLMIIIVIAGVMVWKLSSGVLGTTMIESIGYGFLSAVFIISFYLLYLWLSYATYKKFVDGRSVEDWERFIDQRSDSFLKGNGFVKITLSLRMSPLANVDHHKAVDAFMQKWEADGSSLYSSSKWTGARPDSFKATGKSVSGHIGINYGMKLVLKKLMTDLPELANRLAKDHFTTSLAWSSEVNYHAEDAHDSIDRAKEDERFRKIRDME